MIGTVDITGRGGGEWRLRPKNGDIKKVDFQDFQILLSTVSWGVGGPPANLGK